MRSLHLATLVVALATLASSARAEPGAAAAAGTTAQPSTPAPAAGAAAPPSTPAAEPAAAGTAAAPSAPEHGSAKTNSAGALPASKAASGTSAAPSVSPVTPMPASLAAPSVDTGTPATPRKGPLESRFNVRVDFDTVWYTKPSFDLFSGSDASLFFGASFGYTLFRFDRLSVIPELGFNANHAGASDLFGGAVSSTSLTAEHAYGGIGVRYDVVPILDVDGRLTGGASFAQVELQPSGANASTLEDDGVAPFLSLGAGFTLHTRPGAFETNGGALRSMVAGLSLESGYVFAGSIRLTPRPSDSTARVDTEYMSLGKLDRSGPYLQFSGNLRF